MPQAYQREQDARKVRPTVVAAIMPLSGYVLPDHVGADRPAANLAFNLQLIRGPSALRSLIQYCPRARENLACNHRCYVC